jgi:hypothetical protein
MKGKLSQGNSAVNFKRSKTGRLLWELSDSEDEITPGSQNSIDLQQPWKWDFHKYIDAQEMLPEGMSAITWWGVCHLIYSISFIIYKVL